MSLPAANLSSDTYFYARDERQWLGVVALSPLAMTLFTVDYSDWLDSNEFIISATVTSSSIDLTLSSASVVTASDNANAGVSFTLSGGLSGTSYEVSVFATTNMGEVKVDQISININAPATSVGVASVASW